MRISARGATFGVAATLSLAAIFAPLLSQSAPMLALSIRWFFESACHQRPDRSFLLWGAPVAVCVRCLGIYLGATLGSLSRLRPGASLYACGVALAANCLDAGSEVAGIHGNLAWLRLALGLALGAGAGALLSSYEPPPLPAATPTQQLAS